MLQEFLALGFLERNCPQLAMIYPSQSTVNYRNYWCLRCLGGLGIRTLLKQGWRVSLYDYTNPFFFPFFFFLEIKRVLLLLLLLLLLLFVVVVVVEVVVVVAWYIMLKCKTFLTSGFWCFCLNLGLFDQLNVVHIFWCMLCSCDIFCNSVLFSNKLSITYT